MKSRFDPKRHHRRSIRLRGYDYRQAGAYFVTVCTQDRECLLGEIVEGEMRLNDAGQMVQTVLDQLPDHYPGIDIDEFVVMPNHVHGIIVLTDLVGATPRGFPDATTRDTMDGQAQGPDEGQARGPDEGQAQGPDDGQAQGPAPTGAAAALSLPDVVHRFKSFTTTLYRQRVKNDGWPPFPGRLWQRNYYEHVVRDERSLDAIRQYIADNPARWMWDTYNPSATGPDSQAGDLWRLLQEGTDG